MDSTIPLYRAINEALQERLAKFSPALMVDQGASDPSRLCRIVGSINSKATGSDREVRFWVQADQAGRGFVYTLKGLATLIDARPARFPRIPTKTGVRVPSRRAGWTERWRRPLLDLKLLEKTRKGFARGNRSRAAFVLAYLLRKLRSDPDEIRREVFELAQRCRPPLSYGQAEDAIKGSWTSTAVKTAHMRNETISRWLSVTAAEEGVLRVLKRPGTKALKPEPARAKATRLRRAAIQELIAGAEGKRRPTVRTLRTALQKQGIAAGVATIQADLKALQ